jgi:hypothetical protein
MLRGTAMKIKSQMKIAGISFRDDHKGASVPAPKDRVVRSQRVRRWGQP